MNYFNKKQKIILGGIIITIAGVIYYYTYAKNDYNTQLENNFEVQEEEAKVEEDEDKILVHIAGAIKKEGVIELKENSRISDAINKARRSNRRC